jgi:hypothetical protein
MRLNAEMIAVSALGVWEVENGALVDLMRSWRVGLI